MDWQLPQIGIVSQLLTQKLAEDHIHVLTERNILAKLYKGEVQWRLQLDDQSKAIQFDQDSLLVATTTQFGGVLQVFDTDGFLIKELASFEHGIMDINKVKEHIIVILTDGDVLSIESHGVITFLGNISATEAEIHGFDNGNFIIHARQDGLSFYAFYNGEFTTSSYAIPWGNVREQVGSKIVEERSGKYTVYQINQQTGAFSQIKLPSLEKFVPLDSDSYVAFERDHNLEVFTLEGEKQFIIPNVFKYDLKYLDGSFILYTEFHANIIDEDDGSEIISHPLGVKLDFSQIGAIHTTTDGVERINTLFQYKNGSLHFMRNSQHFWTRDYSLSDAIAHTVVDFEVETALTTDDLINEEALGLVDAYLYRIKRHALELKDLYDYLWSVAPLFVTGEMTFTVVNNDKYFGFKKLLVLAKSNGNVVAIDTINGEIVWSYDTGLTDITQLENFGNEHLYVLTSSGPLHILDSKTGNLVMKQQLVASSLVVRLEDDSLLIETDSGFDVIVGENTQELFTVKHTPKSIRGYKVSNKNAKETWTFEPSSDETIVAYCEKNSNEEVANIGIVLGNRDVLYKYLYPNLASFAVWNEKTKVLHINIVDIITGEILNSVEHASNVIGDSVSLVFGEYWVVYTYFSNQPTPEQKVVVIDLFESLTPNVRLSAVNASSFDERFAPAISTKSFIIPYKVDSLGLTKSRFGVTTKAILFGLSNGQVLLVPKFVLSSRRVAGRDLTGDEKAEFMALPYDAVINIDDNNIISHKRQVLGPKTIVTAATNLESTSIVCTYGLDIFCTRVAPSNQFDKLTSSFDKMKLTGSIVVLTFIVYFLRPMKESKQLKNLWIIEPPK